MADARLLVAAFAISRGTAIKLRSIPKHDADMKRNSPVSLTFAAL